MPLTKCPDCGEEISTAAKQCPNCGRQRTSSLTKGCTVLGIGSILVAFLVVFIGGSINTSRESVSSHDATQPKMSDEEAAAWACANLIKGTLRDPDSASFLTSPGVAPATRDEAGNMHYRLAVRANNGFGGKTVAIFDCTMYKGDFGRWQGDRPQEEEQDQ